MPDIAPAGRFVLQNVWQDNVVMFPGMDVSLHPVNDAPTKPSPVNVKQLPLGVCMFLWFAMAGVCWFGIAWAISVF